MIEGEGFKCLVKDHSKIKKLIVIDKLLKKNYGGIGHLLRNFIKILIFPFQIVLIRRYIRKDETTITFAHSTYYSFLASLSGIKYVSTPQGSEVLVRLEESFLYRIFAYLAHKRAFLVTVDSIAMKKKLKEIINVDSEVVQNGIPIAELLKIGTGRNKKDDKFFSIRGLEENYQVYEIVKQRNQEDLNIGIEISCPFLNENYKEKVLSILDENKDKILGKLDRAEFHHVLQNHSVVISVPLSDSSPRSVYEAIFLGCIVIARRNQYVAKIPNCMSKRVILTDCKGNWLAKALKEAFQKAQEAYSPSREAIYEFDQSKSINRTIKILKEKGMEI
tara:strand:+ start:556 stop:1554 length:999 start_codon:yes stop_codon:yes gene_type:complete